MSVIVVENLRYRYPRQTDLALDGISFRVEPGEFVGIVGPNKAGKSTLCQALVGLVPHFYKGAIGGRVEVAGLDVHASSVAEVSRKAGLVFQSPFTQMSGAKFSGVRGGRLRAGARRHPPGRDDPADRVGAAPARALGAAGPQPLRPLRRSDAAAGHRLGAGDAARGPHPGRAHVPAGPGRAPARSSPPWPTSAGRA